MTSKINQGGVFEDSTRKVEFGYIAHGICKLEGDSNWYLTEYESDFLMTLDRNVAFVFSDIPSCIREIIKHDNKWSIKYTWDILKKSHIIIETFVPLV